jgi:CRP-like cAMP-binding protein
LLECYVATSLPPADSRHLVLEDFEDSGVRVAVVRKTVLNEVIKRRPKFALKLFTTFSERLRQSEEALESLLYREVSARLATLLSHLGGRFGEPHGSGTLIMVRLTHQDLAKMIFSTREAVSKVMSEFQRAGLIEIRSRRIVVNRQLETLY